MTLQIDLKPEVEDWIRTQAQAQGVPVEDFIKAVIESGLNNPAPTEDPRIAAMHDAMHDALFLADLEETMQDFQHLARPTQTLGHLIV